MMSIRAKVSTTALQAGQWYHCALAVNTVGGSASQLYINGVLEATSSTGTSTAFLGPLNFGAWTNNQRFYHGLMDDIRIYDKVLTADEVIETMRGNTALAWGPSPANGSMPDIDAAMPLTWSPGDNASQHDVYFSMDKDAVDNADTSDVTGVYRGRQSETTYTPEGVEWDGGPYYWRIDEYNTNGTIEKGRIWSFTVADFILVDDFESYTDNDAAGEAIWQTWIDGFGVADNGSQVGYLLPPYAEQTIVHSGGQSMPLLYNNIAGVTNSEATRTLTTPRDWTKHGFTDLTGLAAPYWVKLERDAAGNFVAYHSSNGTTWQQVQGAMPQNISMSSNVYIGLAVTSHDAALACQAVFTNVTMTGSVSGQWAHQDIGININAAEPLYVAVSNSAGTPAVVAHDDPAAATIDQWTEWRIPLQAFADQGINLTNVDKIAIGLGSKSGLASAGGSGTMYFDDIRLYKP